MGRNRGSALSQARQSGDCALARVACARPLVRRGTFHCAAPPASSRATKAGASRGQIISPDAESAQEYLTTAEKWITPEHFLLEENFTLFWLEMEISEVFWTSLRGLSSLVESKMEVMVTLGMNIS